MNAALLKRCEAALAERKRNGLLRAVKTRDGSLEDLASNDYLSLARDAAFRARVLGALRGLPTGASASALVNGYLPCHAEFEAELARAYGFDCALLMSSGYAANMGLLRALAGKGDLFFFDALIHRSMIEGVRASGARFFRFRHNDLAHLETLLTAHCAPENAVRWILTESVYSMDGDSPNLPALAALARRNRCVWVLDEAHGVGWYGQTGLGLAEQAGVLKDVDLLIGTLGKACGAQGAFALFRDVCLREHAVNFSPEYIYSTHLSPLACIAAREGWRRARELAGETPALRAFSRAFRAALRADGWAVPDGDSPILPVPIGDESALASLQSFLRVHGFDTGAMRPPAVPKEGARLRVSLKRAFAPERAARLRALLSEWRASRQ